MAKHTEKLAIISLNKKRNLKVRKIGNRKLIYWLREQANQTKDLIGNGSWGKISFLVNYKGYNLIELTPNKENKQFFKKL